MYLMSELSVLGCKYHDKKSNMYDNTNKKFAYHVYMMKLYTGILELTIDSNRLRNKYLK